MQKKKKDFNLGNCMIEVTAYEQNQVSAESKPPQSPRQEIFSSSFFGLFSFSSSMDPVLDRGQFQRCDVLFDLVIKMGRVLRTLIPRPV